MLRIGTDGTMQPPRGASLSGFIRWAVKREIATLDPQAPPAEMQPRRHPAPPSCYLMLCIDQETRARWHAAARTQGITLSRLIRDAITNAIITP